MRGGSNDRFPLLGLQNHCRWWLQPWNWKTIASRQESDDKPKQCVEKQTLLCQGNVHIVKAMIFPVVTYDCESWAVKKAECQRIDTFELWCWRKLLKVPWPARRLNQSILREIKLAYSLERLKLKLKLQCLVIWCEQMTLWKSLWFWERLRAEGEEGIRGWDGWMASPMKWTWTWANSGRWWRTGRTDVLQSKGLQRVKHDWAT